jgi:N-acetyl-alpha-D-muramate 1-phosphate uridylyltransferase
MKAMIFAAGLGTRLGRLTESIPKALVDINGKTALRLAVEKCASQGFDDIIVNIHHFPGMVEEEIGILRQEGFRIEVSDEREELLETGGGLYKARHFFDDSPFLLYNVDIISNIDLAAFYRYHILKKGLATLAARHRQGNRFFLVDGEGLVRGWRNRATGEEILLKKATDLTEIGFSGMHIVEPAIFSFMKKGVYSLTPLYLRLGRRHRIFAYIDDSGYWTDIGTIETLEFARRLVQNR